MSHALEDFLGWVVFGCSLVGMIAWVIVELTTSDHPFGFGEKQPVKKNHFPREVYMNNSELKFEPISVEEKNAITGIVGVVILMILIPVFGDVEEPGKGTTFFLIIDVLALLGFVSYGCSYADARHKRNEVVRQKLAQLEREQEIENRAKLEQKRALVEIANEIEQAKFRKDKEFELEQRTRAQANEQRRKDEQVRRKGKAKEAEERFLLHEELVKKYGSKKAAEIMEKYEESDAQDAFFARYNN